MMALAKPLAGGLPIGATLVTEAVAGALHPGDHGSTFAGGPLITSVALAVFNRICEPQFLASVRKNGAYLMERLSEINSPHIKEIRGRGLMIGVELDIDAQPVIEHGYEHGLLLIKARERVVRFVPPLIIEKTHVDEMVDHFGRVLARQGV
jgi:acetylornithine/succinyldiaminopimelate/putrescine aminotransferase